MEIRYLETAAPGLRWFRACCRRNPQLDAAKAVDALIRAETLLAEFPLSGPAYEDFDAVREYRIQGTAFSLLYTVAKDTIWIIDLRDQRGRRSAEALRLHGRELRARYGIGDDGK